MDFKYKLLALIILCAVFAVLSKQLQASESEECDRREDKCIIIRAMEQTAATEKRIYAQSGAYKWYYMQSNAPHTVGDPALCKHASKCQ